MFRMQSALGTHTSLRGPYHGKKTISLNSCYNPGWTFSGESVDNICFLGWGTGGKPGPKCLKWHRFWVPDWEYFHRVDGERHGDMATGLMCL